MEGQLLSRRKALLGVASGVLGSVAVGGIAQGADLEDPNQPDELAEADSEYVGRITSRSSGTVTLQLDESTELEVTPVQDTEIVDYDGDPISLSEFSVGDTIAVSVGSPDSDGELSPNLITHAVLGERSDVER